MTATDGLMQQGKYTPGPWVGEDVTLAIVQLIVSADEVRAIQVSQADEGGRAIAYIPTDAREAEQRANARVILAAPDLLEAARGILGPKGDGLFPDRGSSVVAWDRLRAAIVKAEGWI